MEWLKIKHLSAIIDFLETFLIFEINTQKKHLPFIALNPDSVINLLHVWLQGKSWLDG